MRKIINTFMISGLLISISVGQLKVNQNNNIIIQIHDNIQEALISNANSEENRLTEEVIQVWSTVNNRWENHEKYTYKYAQPKISTNADIPVGVKEREYFTWNNGNNDWLPISLRNYYYNSNFMVSFWEDISASTQQFLNRNEFQGPYYNGLASSEYYYSWNGSEWTHSQKLQRQFDNLGYPSQVEYFSWADNSWALTDLATTDYNVSYPGCPQTFTFYQCINNANVPFYKYEYFYGQTPCINSTVPNNPWSFGQCNNTQINSYLYDAPASNWNFTYYDVWNYSQNNCLATNSLGYDHSGNHISQYYFYYQTDFGGYPKISSANDNSTTRLIRVVGEYYNNTQWIKSQQCWYSYEDIQMYTEDEKYVANEFELFQNNPNPFNPNTTISYTLKNDCSVVLDIYNLNGQHVVTLLNENQAKGVKLVEWYGIDKFGQKVDSGIYFYKLHTEDFKQTKKMILLK